MTRLSSSLVALLASRHAPAPPARVDRGRSARRHAVARPTALRPRRTISRDRAHRPRRLRARARSPASTASALPYRLLPPLDLERRPSGYPLVVVFHGAGEIGTDNLRQLDRFPKTWARPEIRERFPAFVVAPQMPERSALYSGPAEHARPALAARPAARGRPGAGRRPACAPAHRRHAASTSSASRWEASTTWNALCAPADLFAAAVPIAGVPNPAAADRVARTPVWVVHGTADTANPIGPDRAMVEALRAARRRGPLLGGRRSVARRPASLLAGDELMAWLFAHRR